MTGNSRKLHPLILGIICCTVALGSPFLPIFDRSRSSLWCILALFLAAGVFFVRTAFRKTPELEITDQWISVHGTRFERSNIVHARVFRMFDNGARRRFFEVQFKNMPHLSPGWRLTKLLDKFDRSRKCELGMTLSPEPRLIISLGSTDLADDEINRYLGRSEQEAPSDGGQSSSLNTGSPPRRG